MIEVSITVTLRQTPPTPGPWTRTRHEFRFCAESLDDARYLALANVPSKGYPHDHKELLVEWTRRVYVPESSFLFGPVPQHQVTVVKFESEPLKSTRDVQIEREESEAA